MAMTPEAKVKKTVVKHLKAMGAYYFYPVTGGYGGSGVPDIVGPTPLQEKNLRDIDAQRGIAIVVNEENMNDVEVLLSGER